MKMTDSNEVIEQLIKENQMVLVYFSSESCIVCNVMKQKVERILKDYPQIKCVQVDVEKSLQLSAIFNIFTVPAILLFIEGKEIIREARHISIQEINNNISRYYSLLFE